MEKKPSFFIQDKDEKLDFNKKVILTHQENIKILFPACALLLAAVLAINVTNAMSAYMSVFVCVLVNLISCGGIFFCAYKLVKGEFEVRDKLRDMGRTIYGAYADQPYERGVLQAAPDGLLQNVHNVRIYDMRSAAVILPDGLDAYESRIRTKYSFKGDFGKLVFDRTACAPRREGEKIVYVTEIGDFVFRLLPSGEEDAGQNQANGKAGRKRLAELFRSFFSKRSEKSAQDNGNSADSTRLDGQKSQTLSETEKETDA